MAVDYSPVCGFLDSSGSAVEVEGVSIDDCHLLLLLRGYDWDSCEREKVERNRRGVNEGCSQPSHPNG